MIMDYLLLPVDGSRRWVSILDRRLRGRGGRRVAWRLTSDSSLPAQQYQHGAAVSGELAKEKTGGRTAAFGRETNKARATTP